MKPSWDDAPEWAMWLAMDPQGQWCWSEKQPLEGTTWRWPRDSRLEWVKQNKVEWYDSLGPRP